MFLSGSIIKMILETSAAEVDTQTCWFSLKIKFCAYLETKTVFRS